MAETSYFFNSVGTDREYGAPDFTAFMNLFFFGVSGVLKGVDNQLEVTMSGSSAAVNTGRAIKNGYAYINSASVTKALSNPTINYKRIDRIILRLDSVTARSIVITKVEGTEVVLANPAVAPSITAATDVLLAQILVTNTGGSITYDITDEREFLFHAAGVAIGNASGNIPIANGSECVNLVAASATVANESPLSDKATLLDQKLISETYRFLAGGPVGYANYQGATSYRGFGLIIANTTEASTARRSQSIDIDYTGNIRIFFNADFGLNGGTAYIKKNGSPIVTKTTDTGTGILEYIDTTVTAGDTLSVEVVGPGTGSGTLQIYIQCILAAV